VRTERPSPDRIGLSGYFSFAVLAHECGFRKPDPRSFDAIVRDAQCAAEQITFVGDSLTEDIQPALPAGFRTVWINRDGRRPSEIVDAVEIRSLRELPALL
jgi:FMN hydrolase / 5-amino-6-(5-phospho-D-ribitylamino)uracil phosphatase